MSIEVPPESLAETVAGFEVAYLLTVGGRPRAHVGAVTTTVTPTGTIRVVGVGRTASRHVADDGAVTLLWAPSTSGGYSLIVDGTAVARNDGLDVTPGRAVLHRPATPAHPPAGACAADCREVALDTPTGH